MVDFIPDEMEREVAVSGVWDELGPALAAKYSGLVDRVILYQDFRPGVQDEFWRAMVAGLRDTRA
ncbi:MAG: hypothetical protein HY535_04250 [Chloroflexi bacterium]|nr:hypothetical protein [Chloroflexota bacterium]